MNEVDDTANNPLLEFSLKLCAAVKKEKCLYDRNSVRKNTSPDVEAAWDRVAKECNETIDYCKYRWKSMYKSFSRNYKRCNPYYLHEYMLFLKEDDQQPGTLNDDTNSIDKFNDDVSRQESEIDTINLDDDARSEADSQTASADEMSESVRDKNKPKFTIFLAEENEKDALDIETFGKRKRSNHKRACKRGLDPKLLSELAEDDSEEKRPRRSLERPKTSTPFNEKDLSYKVDSRSVKIKQHYKAEETSKDTLKIALRRSFSLNKNDVNKPKDLQVVDSFTSTDIHYRNAETQCDTSLDSFNQFDEVFFNNLKIELMKMNGRQKMNFKSKIYRALMDVLDDPTDFPNSPEAIKCQPPPLLVNTNTGELRLMRELVALVQAAKSTPEIMKAKDSVTTINTTTAPTTFNRISVKPKTSADANETAEAGLSSQTKHNLLSPSLDEDDDADFQLSTDNLELEEDEVQLPRSLDEIMAKSSGGNQEPNKESNVMGLPKHVLQKVVKVAGTNSSTIVAREGDRRRIYRIYPKSFNQMDGRLLSNKNPNSVGTFYVAPTKVAVPATTNTVSNKTHTSPPTISVKNFANKSANVANAYPASTANHNNQSSNGNAVKKINSPALYKSIHPANRILNASTGLFQTVSTPATSSPPPPHLANNSGKTSSQTSTTGGASFTTTPKHVPLQSSMLPPNSNVVPGFSSKRPLQVRSTQQSPQILHRRFSICGPLSTEQTNNSSNVMQATSKINKFTNSISQIQISKPVSLNKQANSMANDRNTEKKQLDEPMSAPAKSSTTRDKEKPNQTTSATAEETPSKEPEELPIMETAGTITADSLDPLYVKQTTIKSEPVDD